jgi:hypothetical protein
MRRMAEERGDKISDITQQTNTEPLLLVVAGIAVRNMIRSEVKRERKNKSKL